MMIKVVLSFCILGLCVITNANEQVQSLDKLLRSRRSSNPPVPDTWAIEDGTEEPSSVYIAPQDGLAQLDKIVGLPGQPEGVDFDQYSGYITVDPSPTKGKALFYYFVESPQNSSTNPLVLWLNGGPGCSSLIGAFEELGPFRVNTDGRTLSRNKYGWNNFANVLFLESPAGVGFSYSNSSSVYNITGDKSTAQDAYTFLVNWLERFPQYKNRDFYITGESYAGHYVPQLAYTIVLNNKKTNQTIINIKGIAIGNAWIDDVTNSKGLFDYWWTHAINSDETHEGVLKYCNFINDSSTGSCDSFLEKAWDEWGDIDLYNIYAPICLDPQASNGSTGSVSSFDPCWGYHLISYLNTTELQASFHAKPMPWNGCGVEINTDSPDGNFPETSPLIPPIPFNWTDSPITILPVIEYLIANGQRLWIYSGDVDGRVPITSSRYSINAMKLPVQTAFRAWYLNKEVGGYLVEYKGAVLITVRGAGHTVPSYQPERALTMFSSFLEGILPPSE